MNSSKVTIVVGSSFSGAYRVMDVFDEYNYRVLGNINADNFIFESLLDETRNIAILVDPLAFFDLYEGINALFSRDDIKVILLESNAKKMISSMYKYDPNNASDMLEEIKKFEGDISDSFASEVISLEDYSIAECRLIIRGEIMSKRSTVYLTVDYKTDSRADLVYNLEFLKQRQKENDSVKIVDELVDKIFMDIGYFETNFKTTLINVCLKTKGLDENTSRIIDILVAGLKEEYDVIYSLFGDVKNA